jgi:hypothetical protein
MRDVRSRGDAQSVDVDFTTRDGSVRRLRATATLVPEQEGDSVIGVVTDVTGMRHIEHAARGIRCSSVTVRWPGPEVHPVFSFRIGGFSATQPSTRPG